jgi:hypothetical protein
MVAAGDEVIEMWYCSPRVDSNKWTLKNESQMQMDAAHDLEKHVLPDR